ncbi:Dyp-type peroxidase [soil metagenome]
MAAPTDEPLLAVDQIQGNVFPGFRKDHQHFLFFAVKDAAAARACLGKLAARISTMKQVLTSHKGWKAERARLGREPEPVKALLLNVAFSAAGLRKLTSKIDVDAFEDVAFKVGLAERSSFIGDPTISAKAGTGAAWLVGGPEHPVDGVLIMACDDLAWLDQEAKKLEKEITSGGMSVVYQDRGDVAAAPKPGHEQFGFKDGISHIAMRGRMPDAPWDFVLPRTLPTDKTFDAQRPDFAEPGGRLEWPGHYVFGYGRQEPDDPRKYTATDQAKGPSWATNGSFMVYRRLRQDTKKFEKFVAETALALAKSHPKTAPDKERFGAMLVGRWKSGTPIERSPDKDLGITGPGLNYFSFADAQKPALPKDTAPLNPADPDGLRCPLAAHIRKVNPRDQATDLGFVERTPPRSLLRRGITYATSDSDKGLLFVAYQSSITDQFEFLMREWVKKPNLPRDEAGHDPILSQGPGRYFNLPIDKTVEKIALPSGLVTPTGGEYLFSPSIDFFKKTLAKAAP